MYLIEPSFIHFARLENRFDTAQPCDICQHLTSLPSIENASKHDLRLDQKNQRFLGGGNAKESFKAGCSGDSDRKGALAFFVLRIENRESLELTRQVCSYKGGEPYGNRTEVTNS